MRHWRMIWLMVGTSLLLMSLRGRAAELPSWPVLAERWLETACPEPGTRWSVSVLRAPDWAPGPDAVVDGGPGAAPHAKKIMRLRCRRSAADRAGDGELLVAATRWRRVAVAKRPLEPRTPLAEADWAWEERPAAGLPPDAVSDERDLSARRARKFVAAREPLSLHALEPVPEVLRHQRVALCVRGTGVCVRTEGTALTEGRRGEPGRFRLDSGRVVEAWVAGPAEAEIALAGGR